MIEELCDSLSSFEFERNSALSFSGGLDSGIIAYLMRDYEPVLYTVGVEGSRDIGNALEASEILSLPLRVIYVDEEDIVEGISSLREIDASMNPIEIGFDLPLYFIARDAEEGSIYTGQGADELFGGYRKYLEDHTLMEKDTDLLMKRTLPRERKIVERFGKKLFTPYLTREVVDIARKIDAKYKIRSGERKWILREVARTLGVPEEIVRRKKKAAQYGSGIWKMMKKMAKKRGLTLEDFIIKV